MAAFVQKCVDAGAGVMVLHIAGDDVCGFFIGGANGIVDLLIKKSAYRAL